MKTPTLMNPELRQFIVESGATKYSLFPVPAFVMTVQGKGSSAILARRCKAERLFRNAGEQEIAAACAGDPRLRYEIDLLQQGELLSDRLAKVTLNAQESWDIGRALTFELSFLHKCGVTHGAVACENIMLCPKGYVRLLNFRHHSCQEADVRGYGSVLEAMGGNPLADWRYSKAAEIESAVVRIRPKAIEPYGWAWTLLYRTSWVMLVALLSYDVLRHLK